MLIIKDGMRINTRREVQKISQLLVGEMERLGRDGVVLGLSGGLDSSVCASICVTALGKKKVHTFILPERDSSQENVDHAHLIAQGLGLAPITIDITPLLEHIGVYQLIKKDTANNLTLIKKGIQWITNMSGNASAFGVGMSLLYGNRKKNVLTKLAGKPLDAIHAFALSKVRTRMLVLYFHALQVNCLVVGTTDRSEWQIGFYDKYGDGACDIALLRHLYKNQIRDLARYLSLPECIINKPSSGDLAANLPNESAIGFSYEQLDAMLWGLEQQLPDQEIISQLGVHKKELAALKDLKRIAGLREGLPAHL